MLLGFYIFALASGTYGLFAPGLVDTTLLNFHVQVLGEYRS